MLSKPTYREAYVRFLARFRQARLDAGLTQEKVARRLGKPQSFVSNVESSYRCRDFVELQILARIYKKQLSYFAGDVMTESPWSAPVVTVTGAGVSQGRY